MKNKIIIIILAALLCFAPQLQAKSSFGKYAAIAAGAAIVGAVIANQCNDSNVNYHYCFVCGSILKSHEVSYWGCRGNYNYPTYCPHNVIVERVVRPIVRPIVINKHRPKREVIIKHSKPKKHNSKPKPSRPKKDGRRNSKRR